MSREDLDKKLLPSRTESFESLHHNIAKIAAEFVELYPQTDENGLVYYFGGSLAVSLFALSNSITTCDRHDPHSKGDAVLRSTKSTNARSFLRLPKDIDFVLVQAYKALSIKTPFLAENNKNKISVLDVHRINDSLGDLVFRGEVLGQHHFFEDPHSVLKHKLMELCVTPGFSEQVAKISKDAELILQTLMPYFSRGDTVKRLRDGIFGELERISALTGTNIYPTSLIVLPYNNHRYSGLRSVMRDIVSSDPDSKHLKRITFGHERALAFLVLLHGRRAEKSKELLVDFINKTRSLIDRKVIDWGSESNIRRFARLVLGDKKLKKKVFSILSTESDLTPRAFSKIKSFEQQVDTLTRAICKPGQVWLFSWYNGLIKQFQLADKFHDVPTESYLLRCLTALTKNEASLQTELDELYNISRDLSDVDMNRLAMIMNSPLLSDETERRRVMMELSSKKRELNEVEFIRHLGRTFGIYCRT